MFIVNSVSEDSFVETLRAEYLDEVQEIIYNCQFSSKNYLDVTSLNSNLKALRILNFRNETLSEDNWFELLYELTPEIYDELTCGALAA